MLISRLPDDWRERRLVVPFLGAGNFYGGVGSAMLPRPLLADYTRPLVLAHRAIKGSPERLAEQVRKMPVSRPQFMATRRRLSKVVKSAAHPGNKYTVGADFLYLMRTGFNGLWRCSQKGGVNTSWGKPTPDFEVWSPHVSETVWAWHALLKRTDAILRCQDFRATLKQALAFTEPLLIFADPPYWPLQLPGLGTPGLLESVPEYRDSWDDYTPIGFSARDHADLLALLAEHLRRGAFILSTNHHHAAWEARYQAEGFGVKHFDNRRNGNSDASKRGAVKEVLFIGRP